MKQTIIITQKLTIDSCDGFTKKQIEKIVRKNSPYIHVMSTEFGGYDIESVMHSTKVIDVYSCGD